jgi:hypothetical protein
MSDSRACDRLLVVGIALVLLLGALITPWGLAKSHGLAAVASPHQGESLGLNAGHDHEGDFQVSTGTHIHHAGDHSHDQAHVVPKGLPDLGEVTAVWRQRPTHPGPWPSLDGLERPPRT